MFNNLIIILHFVIGAVCLLGFLDSISVIKSGFLTKKLLTKISLLALSLSTITLALIHANVLRMFQVSLFGASLLLAVLSMSLFVFSELRDNKKTFDNPEVFCLGT